ncbi:MAG TPA: alpha/beta fold hydrolase [Burkholderiales bacterium]
MRQTKRLGSLVRVTTAQKYELTGFYAPADRAGAPTILYTHGLSGSFETNFIFNLLDLPGIERFNVLSTTSSGHGNIATTRRGEPPLFRLTGSAFEVFADCVPDLAAWVDFAAKRSKGPVILFGHSLGSSKVTHYYAQTGDPRIAALVLASASDVTGGFMDNVGREKVPGFVQKARELVQAGRPEAIMPDDCVIGLLKQRISAATVLDRFEAGALADQFDFYGRGSSSAFQDLAKIDKPIFAIYCKTGELVGSLGVEGAIKMLKQRAVKCPSFDSLVVSGNHWYMGHEDEAMGGLLRWANSVVRIPA